MAWEARSGLKLMLRYVDANNWYRLNGLGSPFGIETLPKLAQVVHQVIG